ncbi:hypothetical protein HA402_006224 [Bradysia odoriphaga]|nr:hypothetical protein HA402_006224 [Bradysia odoriphaga]
MVQRRLFVDDAVPLESDLHCSETVECESMDRRDVTILNEKLPDLYSAIQFRVRQTSRESSDTETEETKPKKIKTRLDIPSPQTFHIPSTSPRKSADYIVMQCPFPSEKSPNNHLNEMNGDYKYYVLTENGMQGHH